VVQHLVDPLIALMEVSATPPISPATAPLPLDTLDPLVLLQFAVLLA